MAGFLLMIVLVCSFSELKAKGLPPTLTVDPAVITDTDSVTLNCQPPPSVPVSDCYFKFMRGRPAKRFSCVQTLTGTELLKLSQQSSPAVVSVSCFYLRVSQSPESHMSSIIIRTSLPPTLRLNQAVINEMDSVTLNCQPPSSVSASHCYFITVGGGPVGGLSCVQTLTGSDLLKMEHQSSPVEVKLTCYYTVRLGEEDSPSPHSAASSITIHRQKPELSLHHSPGESVIFTCSLPGSAQRDTRCNLYLGESSHPFRTTNIWSKTSSKQQSFCLFSVQISDLLRQLRSVQHESASCDYTIRGGSSSLSPRSDGYSLTDIVETESHTTTAMPTSTSTAMPTTTGQKTEELSTTTAVTSVRHTKAPTVDTLSTVGSTTSTSAKPPTGLTSANMKGNASPGARQDSPSGQWIMKSVVVAAGCGVAVGVMLMVSAVLCNRRKAVTGSEESKKQELLNPSYDSCYYSTITDGPAETALNDMLYSSVEAH